MLHCSLDRQVFFVGERIRERKVSEENLASLVPLCMPLDPTAPNRPLRLLLRRSSAASLLLRTLDSTSPEQSLTGRFPMPAPSWEGSSTHERTCVLAEAAVAW